MPSITLSQTKIANGFLEPLNLLSYAPATTSLQHQPPTKPACQTSLLPLLLEKILIFTLKMLISATFPKD
jgi:hypothetical protein